MNCNNEILNSENTTINTASESEQAVEPAAAPVECETVQENNTTPLLTLNPNHSDEYKSAIRGAVKIMDGQYGGGFFARYMVDTGRMYSWLNLIIVYPDGLYKSITLFKNCLKETDTDNGNGVYTPDRKHSFYIDDADLKNYVQFPQYETPHMPIPAQALWEKLVANKENIPYAYIRVSATVDEVYKALKDAAQEEATSYQKGFLVSNDRFLVDSKLFRETVESYGRTVSEVRTEFDLRGWFFKDKGTKGFQISKVVDGERKRFYAIRSELPTTGAEPTSLEDTTYQYQGPKSKLKNELAKKDAEIMRLTGKCNQAVYELNKYRQKEGLDTIQMEL